MPKTIHRKIWPEYFCALASGDKTFEVRNDDRPDEPFERGDVLQLEEWDPRNGTYTTKSIRVLISYVLPMGATTLGPNTVVLGIKREDYEEGPVRGLMIRALGLQSDASTFKIVGAVQELKRSAAQREIPASEALRWAICGDGSVQLLDRPIIHARNWTLACAAKILMDREDAKTAQPKSTWFRTSTGRRIKLAPGAIVEMENGESFWQDLDQSEDASGSQVVDGTSKSAGSWIPPSPGQTPEQWANRPLVSPTVCTPPAKPTTWPNPAPPARIPEPWDEASSFGILALVNERDRFRDMAKQKTREAEENLVRAVLAEREIVQLKAIPDRAAWLTIEEMANALVLDYGMPLPSARAFARTVAEASKAKGAKGGQP